MQDESLQTELKKRVAAQEGKDEITIIETVLIPFGQELDLPFTLEEYQSAQANSLSEEELEVVSGGSASAILCTFTGLGALGDQLDCSALGAITDLPDRPLCSFLIGDSDITKDLL